MDLPRSLIAPEVVAAMLKRASATPKGCFVEVGVFQGGSAIPLSQVAKDQNRDFFGYDTFEGIPCYEGIDYHKIGDFCYPDLNSLLAKLPCGRLVKGIFPDTLLPETTQIAFVHLDVDQYASYRNAIEALRYRMVPGGIMWFDDAGLTHLPGASKACLEAFSSIQMDGCNKWFTVF